MNSLLKEKKAFHIRFEGRVQGVGFRFTVRALALRHDITGWAMNLNDGAVEVFAEGKPDNLNIFVDDLKEEFRSYITNCKLNEVPFSGECQNFQIRFS